MYLLLTNAANIRFANVDIATHNRSGSRVYLPEKICELRRLKLGSARFCNKLITDCCSMLMNVGKGRKWSASAEDSRS